MTIVSVSRTVSLIFPLGLRKNKIDQRSSRNSNQEQETFNMLRAGTYVVCALFCKYGTTLLITFTFHPIINVLFITSVSVSLFNDPCIIVGLNLHHMEQ